MKSSKEQKLFFLQRHLLLHLVEEDQQVAGEEEAVGEAAADLTIHPQVL